MLSRDYFSINYLVISATIAHYAYAGAFAWSMNGDKTELTN